MPCRQVFKLYVDISAQTDDNKRCIGCTVDDVLSNGIPKTPSNRQWTTVHQWRVRRQMPQFNIEQEWSDPHYPTSNGHAEKMVAVAKSMIKKVATGVDLQSMVHVYNATVAKVKSELWRC